MEIKPQPGPQSAFLSSSADIVIYGGSAGGGKTWGLLLEPLRHIVTNRRFYAVIFRRTTTQVLNPGGLWDASLALYTKLGARPIAAPRLEWRFPQGGKLKFAHLQHDINVQDWQGSEIPLIAFDELTHFTKAQFFYLLSRNRSTAGVRPYIRATCNPDADSWVAEFIAWWIDQDTGLPIPERAGVLRWFLRINDVVHWSEDKDDLIARFVDQVPSEQLLPKSLTFIPASLTDNAILMKADPGYMANLLALPRVERERLLGGNWKVRAAAGMYFQRTWLKPVPWSAPGSIIVRGYDIAATEKTDSNDPDYSETVKIARDSEGRFTILDHDSMRGTPGQVQAWIKRNAVSDGKNVTISLPQDPAQAGKAQAAAFVNLLAGYPLHITVEGRTPDNEPSTAPSTVSAKVARFGPFSAQCEHGNVFYVQGEWNGVFFDRLESFPESRHKDTADATSRAFNALAEVTFDSTLSWVG